MPRRNSDVEPRAEERDGNKPRHLRWMRKSGAIYAPPATYFRLLAKAQDEKRDWLQRKMHDALVASFIASPYRFSLSVLPHIASFVEGRRSLLGLESVFLGCMRAVQVMGNRRALDGALSSFRSISPTRSGSVALPILFFDPSRKILTVCPRALWPKLYKRLISGMDQSASIDIGLLVRQEFEDAGRVTDEALLDSNPIRGVLIALGAAMDAPLSAPVSGLYDDDDGDGGWIIPPEKEPPSVGDIIDDVKAFLNYDWQGLGGRIKGVLGSFEVRGGWSLDFGGSKEGQRGPTSDVLVICDDWDDAEEEPASLPKSDDSRTLEEVLPKSEPLTEAEIDRMTGPTPPPSEDGRTLDEVLGEPDPPLTPEEIDDLTGTPNPDDVDGPRGPAYTPNPMNENDGPRGPAYRPNPDSDRPPKGPAYMPRPDDERGPAGPAARRLSRGMRYFPKASAFFVPVRTRTSFITALSYAELIGVKGVQGAASVNYLLRTPIKLRNTR